MASDEEMAALKPNGKKRGQQVHMEDSLIQVMEHFGTSSGTKTDYGFNSRSNMIHTLTDVGLLAANFGQLKVIDSYKQNKYYHLNLVLVSLSVVCQILFLACMFVIWYYEYKVAEQMKKRDKILKSQGNENDTDEQAGDSKADNSETTSTQEAKIKTGMRRLVILNICGFVLTAVIIVINICLSVFFEGGDSDGSTENIGRTR